MASLLDRLHGGAPDTTIKVPEALLEQSRRTQRLFDIVMGAIAGISLLVGGIGIMSIMLVTVLERTRETGVRRAVGARRRDIRNQFVVEAFAVTVTGGVLGVVMGLAIAQGVAAHAGWNTVVTVGSIVLSVGVSMGVGLASGNYPSLRVARLDPVEALRYEELVRAFPGLGPPQRSSRGSRQFGLRGSTCEASSAFRSSSSELHLASPCVDPQLLELSLLSRHQAA